MLSKQSEGEGGGGFRVNMDMARFVFDWQTPDDKCPPCLLRRIAVTGKIHYTT